MIDYHNKSRHWTSWQKAISKWSNEVWDALAKASAGSEPCELAAIDGTTHSRSNPSDHYLKRIDRDGPVGRPVQDVVLVDVLRRKFLSWRFRARPRGEKCDVPYIIRKSPVLPDIVLMDKGFDSNPLHTWLRDRGIWSIAPVRKGCKRGNYRRQLRDCFDWALYWQRSIIECLFSAIKRLFGSHIRARTARMQRAEMNSRFIAYNIGAILPTTFYRACFKKEKQKEIRLLLAHLLAVFAVRACDAADAHQQEEHSPPVQIPETPNVQVLQQKCNTYQQHQDAANLLTLCTSHHGNHLFALTVLFYYLSSAVAHCENSNY